MEWLSTLPSVVQLALITGAFVLILIVAYNRTAAKNIIRFLRDLLDLYSPYSRYRTHMQSCAKHPSLQQDQHHEVENAVTSRNISTIDSQHVLERPKRQSHGTEYGA